MLNPFAIKRLEQFYRQRFQPLNDCPVARRKNTPPGCPDLMVMRMLCQRPDGRLMQVLGTIGASEFRLPREEDVPARRNEYVTFLPADWDLDDPQHRWVMDMLADLSDYAADAKRPLYYGHKLDMRQTHALLHAADDMNMAGAVLLAPLSNSEPMTCRTGLFTQVNIIHMMPITAAELDRKSIELVQQFYPETGEVRFLCARHR